jgi:hypothetical protein
MIYRGVTLLMQIPMWLVGTVIFDWIVTWGASARAPSVDYHYWPPSALRLTTLVALAASVTIGAYYGFQPEWTLFLTLLTFIIYGAAIVADIERQRDGDEEGETSPRYSDADGDR